MSIPVEDGPHPQDDSEDAATPATMVPSGCGPGTTMADVLRSPKGECLARRTGPVPEVAADFGDCFLSPPDMSLKTFF